MNFLPASTPPFTSIPTNAPLPPFKYFQKYLKGGNGALVGIEVKGGVEAGKKFIEALKMFYHVANIGDARSLAIHPATTTHSQLTEEELLAAGVTPRRYSCCQ